MRSAGVLPPDGLLAPVGGELGRRTALRGPLLRAALVAILALAGAMVLVQAAWVPVKAAVAQVLLGVAWDRAAAGEEQPRPWPWADTWPVARLSLPGQRPLVVLAGASGRTLAFGPGHVDGTAAPGEPGNVVVAGHRDTHFRLLGELRPGDRLQLEDPTGGRRSYRVATAAVVHHTDTAALQPGVEGLTLVTCWPFEALHPGGPLRYVVTALAE